MNNFKMQTKFQERKKKPDLSPLLYGKISPQAIDLEGAVLGALMLEPQRVQDVTSIISSYECFYSDANQRIYACIRRLFDKGSRIDFMTVCEDLRKNSELEMVGGNYYVMGLTRDVVSGANIEEHAAIIMQKYVQREVIRIAGEAISEAYEDSTDVFDLLAQTERKFTSLSEDNIRTGYKHISHKAAEDIIEIEERINKQIESGYQLTGVSSGFPTIDRVTNGWQGEDLIILAARPSVGKTAFALNLAMNAKKDGKPCAVGFFSLEMSLEKLRMRVVSMQTKVPLTNISACQLDELQINKLRSNIGTIGELPIYIYDQYSLTVHELITQARRMKKKHNVGLLIIDYLQLIQGSNGMIREQQIAEISRKLKGLAKELEIPIIALSQLNRDIEKRKGEPQLSDIRDSGAIEQDADLIWFLFWHDNLIRAKLAKHRNGKLDRVDFNPNLDIQTFRELGQDFPEVNTKGFEPTEYSGRLIPMAEANKKFEDEEELPF